MRNRCGCIFAYPTVPLANAMRPEIYCGDCDVVGMHCWDGGHSEFTQFVDDGWYPNAEEGAFFDHNYHARNLTLKASQDEFIEPEVGAEELELDEHRFDTVFEAEDDGEGLDEVMVVIPRRGAECGEEDDSASN